VKKRPHELALERAPSIGGSLQKIVLSGVKVSNMYDPAPQTRAIDLGGPTAFFAYRFAWRRAENTGRFTIAEDALGTFRRTAESFGDGPGYADVFHFTRMNVSFGGVYEQHDDGDAFLHEGMHLAPPAHPNDRAPLAECVRDVRDGQAAPPYKCTGL
jgi:hypothetical protein